MKTQKNLKNKAKPSHSKQIQTNPIKTKKNKQKQLNAKPNAKPSHSKQIQTNPIKTWKNQSKKQNQPIANKSN